jgi:hypothetical protein
MYCHYEFVLSGMAQAVAEEMPFEVVGATLMIVAVNPLQPDAPADSGAGELCLTLLVMSSDDVDFKTVMTDPVKSEDEFSQACDDIFKSVNKPQLIFTFAPDYANIPGGMLAAAVTKASGGVPVFGGYSCDNSPMYNENCFVFGKKGVSRDQVVFVLLYGDVNPKFFTASISEDKVLSRWALVTKAQGSELIELNGKPVTEYLRSFGLTKEIAHSGPIHNLSLIISDETDAPFYSRTMVRFTENSTLICGGEVPERVHVRVGIFERGDMLNTVRSILKKAVSEANGERSAAFVVCCGTRVAVLGADSLAEVDLLREAAGDMPFLLGYAAGEICPLPFGDKRVSNRFHNQSFTMCIL